MLASIVPERKNALGFKKVVCFQKKPIKVVISLGQQDQRQATQ
jgi:hypothetical protein